VKSEPSVIAWSLSNQKNSDYTTSTLLEIDSRSKLGGIKPSLLMIKIFIAEKIITLLISLID
tara:strand:+ start:334 stop:519 length:186 start_codon:yes stop_codon:yes gene_type:complete